jgi:hypothetical protein
LARIDQVDQGALLQVQAVRMEPGVATPADYPDDLVSLSPVAERAPVFPLLMDLPLLSDVADRQAPYLAVTASPWPGAVAVYQAVEDADYRLSTQITGRSVMGVTVSPMLAAPMGRPDLGAALEVKLTSGQLESVTDTAFMAGANLFAIGDGAPGGWELFQARDAALIGPDTWGLSHRLRGQLGTEVEMPEVWPAGSYVVALNGTPEQLEAPWLQRGAAHHFRIGPDGVSYDDPVYRHIEAAFQGIGLRPYAPVHLRWTQTEAGQQLTWLRRTRIDGDGWEALEVPLGEEREQYLVQIHKGSVLMREAIVEGPSWLYSVADLAADGPGLIEARVAQISARYGAGASALVPLAL